MTSQDGAGAAWPAATGTPATVDLGQAGERDSAEAAGNTPVPVLVNLPVDLPNMLREIETTYINAALAQTRSNKKEAAKLLGMGRTTLVEKLRRRNLTARG
jgi:DNA-binding NtrC family response regulator